MPIPLVNWQTEPESGHDPAEVASRFMYDPNGTPFAVPGDPSFFYYEHLISRDRYSRNSPVPGIRLEF